MLRPLKAWGKTSIGSVAMGHEISVTSVQLAQACSVIANGGYLVKPKLVLGAQTDPPVRILKPETAITMRHMMEGVVIKTYGTGYKYARIPGYSSGGKTGTAQIYDFKSHVYTHLYNASFMGFAPVNDPAVVVVVTVNGTTGQAGYGGPVSGPPFREVAAAALRLLDVPKDLPDEPLPEVADNHTDENDVALTDLASDAPQPLVQAEALDQRVFFPASIAGPKVPNFLGKTKREVVEESAEDGVPIDFEGYGIARSQDPPPNSPLSLGQHVLVKLAR
jgi:cell division protein FtsI (penicillin-binding protein 3)